MVYNRAGMGAWIAILRNHILRGGLFRQSLEESLYTATDGFSARYYVAEQFEDLFRTFFGEVSSTIVGQETDAVPLPRLLRATVLRAMPMSLQQRMIDVFGSFIFLIAKCPD
jgi:hypothetical protein